MEIKTKCACCGYYTVEGIFAICPVCFWQSDFVQEENDNDNGGPNNVSLREAKKNYEAYGAMEEGLISLTRPPTQEEINPEGKP